MSTEISLPSRNSGEKSQRRRRRAAEHGGYGFAMRELWYSFSGMFQGSRSGSSPAAAAAVEQIQAQAPPQELQELQQVSSV